MKSESIFTLVMTVLAIVLGIINNNQKAKKREQQARRKIYDEPDREEPYRKPEFQLSVAPEAGPTAYSEGERALTDDSHDFPVHAEEHPQKSRKYGFNAKEAVLFSEILRPKFDEFG